VSIIRLVNSYNLTIILLQYQKKFYFEVAQHYAYVVVTLVVVEM